MPGLRQRLREWVELPERRFRARARVLRPWHVRRFAAFGEGTLLVRPRLIKGGRKIAIGRRCLIYPDCSLSVERTAWSAPGPRLVLGDGVVLQSNVTITCAEHVELADSAAIGANALISDNDHTIDGSAESILATPLVCAPVRIGRGVWVGHNCSIVKGARIGDFSVIGANSVVRGEIPPYSVAVGAPARVVGRVPHPDAPADAPVA
jgi:acetyltransferase-like isoleucine patch superfamily enzyme